MKNLNILVTRQNETNKNLCNQINKKIAEKEMEF